MGGSIETRIPSIETREKPQLDPVDYIEDLSGWTACLCCSLLCLLLVCLCVRVRVCVCSVLLCSLARAPCRLGCPFAGPGPVGLVRCCVQAVDCFLLHLSSVSSFRPARGAR